MSNYFGKYKAQVVDVNDPQKLKRVRVKCPTLLGDHISGWCTPCFPITDNADLKIAPRKGEYIWIEFEQGKLSKPVYVGTWR